MAQTMTQRLTDAIMQETQSGAAEQSASLGTADEEQTRRLKQAVKDGVLEGLEEHDRKVEQQSSDKGDDSSSSSGGFLGKLLGSAILLAVMALLRRRMQGDSGSGGSNL